MKSLSRNVPVALVVGAAGFIGSHLTDKLLEKGIQVVGVDDLSTGSMDNLKDAVKNSRFHFVKASADENISFDLPKLNYAFFAVTENILQKRFLEVWDNFLRACNRAKCKIVLVSSIRLYNPHEDRLDALRKAEKVLADFAARNNLNARIVRLSTVFGPRSHFRENDPMIHLIKAAASESLQTETTALDFTTRAIYINDAVDLLIKAVMHGATSQKIYDGALSVPIKVAEIKQVLLDPLWHEERGFVPTELPPWPSPNLVKTMRELSWQPHSNIVQSLKNTLIFYRGRKDLLEDKKSEAGEDNEKVHQMRAFLKGEAVPAGRQEEEKADSKKGSKGNTIVVDFRKIGKQVGNYSYIIAGLALIIYAFIYPVTSLAVNFYSYKTHIRNSLQEASKGNFNKAQEEIKKAQVNARAVREVVGPLAYVGKIQVFNPEVKKINALASLLQESAGALEASIKAGSYFELGIKSMSGEITGDPQQYFNSATGELDKAERTLSFADAVLASTDTTGLITSQLKKEINSVREKNDKYRETINFGRTVSFIIPTIISPEGRKSYLILLEDNTSLRPGGGVIAAYGDITFDKGRLVNIHTGNIDTLDQKLSEKLTPPADVANDLNKDKWAMQDSNLDLDFPTSAKLAQWFYKKEAGVEASGVIMLDLTAVEKMLEANGLVTLATTGEKITSGNLLQKTREASNRKEFLNTLLSSFLNKTFYITRQNWPETVVALQSVLAQKHMLFYFNDPTLLAYSVSNNWSGMFAKQAAEEKGEREEFVSIFETDLDGNVPNYFIDKKVNLDTQIDKEGRVKHKLEVSYGGNLQSSEDVNGRLRKRIKIYLAAGSKLTKAKMGETDITKSVSSFTDYGRAGYSLVFDVRISSPTTLAFEYQDLKPLDFVGNEAKLKLDIFKQPGDRGGKFDYKVTYPEGWASESKDFQTQNQSLNFSTNLVQDLSLKATFKKQAKL